MKNSVKAFAPASVSNVACGFDIMGFALEQPGDHVTVSVSDIPGVRIVAVRGEGAELTLPREPSLNTAGAPVIAMFRDHGGTTVGIDIEIDKGLPVGSGIGSSAASAVAAAVACNELLGAGLSREDVMKYAIRGELIASGAIHVDNLAPCLWGGFVLVRGYAPIDLVHLRVPDGLTCTVICPGIEIRTLEARKILPKDIPLKDVIAQTGNAAGLVAGLLSSNFELISRSLHDVVAEPARSCLIPGFAQMKLAALDAGALGCSISGSGPALFALSTSQDIAGKVGRAMGDILDERSLAYKTYISPVARSGAHIVS